MSDTREANPTAMDTTESGSSQFHLQKERQSTFHAENGAVASLPQREAHIHTVSQVPLPPYQKLANPGPLGLLAFALTTFVLGLYECGAG